MHTARFVFGAFATAGLALLSGCASSPKAGEYSARALWSFACADPGAKTITGSVWTKVKSDELSGQFPASVRVDYPGRLAVEVTNLIGAPQAWLKMENGKTDLRYSAQNEKQYGKAPPVQTAIGGLPLVFAPRIFAGAVPCPAVAGTVSELNETGGLVLIAKDARTGVSTQYVYSFGSYLGKPWVSEVRLETAEMGTVTIKREQPVGPDAAPNRWSASSSRGEIQVRWKDRNVVSTPKGKQ